MNRISVRTFVTVLVLVFLVTAILASAMTFMLTGLAPALPNKNTAQDTVLEKELQEIQGVIDKNYYKPAEESALEEGAMRGMVAALQDPYSTYMSPKEAEEFFRMSQGQYSGVGITANQDPKTLEIKIISTAEGAPAQKAGIKPGDMLLAVDGMDIAGMPLEQVTSKIKGEEGTTVRLTMLRGTEKMEFEMVRALVTMVNIASEMLPDNIGYIRIGEFSTNIDTQFTNEVNKLKSQGMKGLVIDLRDNPGGLVEATSKIADTLLPEGTIFYTMDRSQKRQDITSDAQSLGLPIVVLVNGNSASASEILSGALQDNGTALVGTKTYGKGVIQSFFRLSNGATVKLTILEYFTPKGREIQGKGLTPDFEVELPQNVLDGTVRLTDENDTQLQKAIEVMKGKLGI